MYDTVLTGTGSKENLTDQNSKNFVSRDLGISDTSRKRNFKDVSSSNSYETWNEATGVSQNVDDEEKYCRVCGDISSGNHYGSPSCDGCRGFFKRCVRYGSDYACLNPGGSCSVDYSSRTRCQACRYQKCLAVGMFRAAVQNPRILEELTNFADFGDHRPKLRKIDSNENHENTECNHACENVEAVNSKKSFGFDITNLLGLDQAGTSENPERQTYILNKLISPSKGESENINTESVVAKDNQSSHVVANNKKRKHKECASSGLSLTKRIRSAFVACDVDRFDYVKNVYDKIRNSIFYSSIPQARMTDVFTLAWRAIVLLHFAEPDSTNWKLRGSNPLQMRFLELLKIHSKLINNEEIFAKCVDFVIGLSLLLTQVDAPQTIETSMMRILEEMQDKCKTPYDKFALICTLGLCLTAMDTNTGMMFPNYASLCGQIRCVDKTTTAIFGSA